MRVIASYDTSCFVANGNEVLGLNFTDNSCRTYKFEKNEGSSIITITAANDGKYVFAGFSSKVVCCWDRLTGELLGNGLFKKRPTAIVYSPIVNSEHAAVLVSDKTGDVWGADVPLLKKQIILAGHTASVVTDMEIYKNLVVTADRDEKLRVSRFPDLETIVSYCLGHTSVVSSATFLSVDDNALLVSASWDHRLCLWNPTNGKLLATKLYPNTVTEPEADVIEDTADASEPVDEAEEEEEEEELEEKTYDERTAGNFPFKVTACSSTNAIAVIFRNLSTLKVYRASVQDYSPSSSSSSVNDFAGETSLELLAVPSDIVFLGNRLVALLPQPFYLQVLDITFNTDKAVFDVVDVTAAEGVKAAVETFVKQCIETGASFSQVSADQLDEEKNMKKHALDRPFDKTKNIDYGKKRGSKRSKKV